jgi:hypothetical protein
MVQSRPRQPVQVGSITTPPVAPSIQPATAAFAELEKQREAMNEAGRMSRMAFDKGGASVDEANVLGGTPGSYVKDVVPDLPTQADAALGRDMALGAFREKQPEGWALPYNMVRHPFASYGQAARVTPIIRALDQRAGGPAWANVIPNVGFTTLRSMFNTDLPQDFQPDQSP